MNYPGLSGPALIIRHTGQVFPLTKTPVTIGRQADNVMVLADPQASRHHAVISWQANGFIVEDLNSANGTYVNEERLTGSRPLRHGDTLRMGNTVMEAQLAPPVSPTQQVSVVPEMEGEQRSSLFPIFIGLLVAGILIACLAIASLWYLSAQQGKPTVTVQSPAAGSQLLAGNEVLLQATAAGARDISRLELRVDEVLVAEATSPTAEGMASLTVSKPWTFGLAGPHVVSAIAYTTRGAAGEPASAEVTVVDSMTTITPTFGTATASPTVPSPESPTPTARLPTNTEPPTATATGTPLPTSTPTATRPPAPRIEFFRTNPSSILSGACTTLEWGTVTNASEAVIDHGIGGVGTPGNTTVCPTATTTYVLTATGPGGTATASATVTVTAPQPDLRVESIVFDPDPAVQGQPALVRITIRNVGAGAAGAFSWEWLAGSEARFDGRPASLNGGESTVVTASWTPASVVASLPTVARVDIGNEVTESDESNNALTVNVQVVAPSTGDLVLQEFFLSTDNQIVIRLSNPGGGITAPTFGYEIYQDDALVDSGSDTTPTIGSRASWTGYVVTGEHTMRVVLDPDDLIAESDEGNNELTLYCIAAAHSCSPP